MREADDKDVPVVPDSRGARSANGFGRRPRGEQVSTGIYFLRMDIGQKSFTRKMVLLK